MGNNESLAALRVRRPTKAIGNEECKLVSLGQAWLVYVPNMCMFDHPVWCRLGKKMRAEDV